MRQELSLRFLLSQKILNTYSSMSQFSISSAISRSVFSLIFRETDPKPISFDYLTKITLSLGYKEDYFFKYYIDECFYKGKPNRSRIEPFLIRCAELNREDCIEEVLERLNIVNDERYVSLIFEIAKKLTANPKHTSLFFKWFLKRQKEHNSEKIAIAKYYVFISSISDDESKNLELLTIFEPVRSYLPDELKIHALLIMTQLHHILNNISAIEELVDELISTCLRLFGTKDEPRTINPTPDYPWIRSPVVYYGQGYLIKQDYLFDKGEYEAALPYSDKYIDLSWFPYLDEKGQCEVEKLTVFAKANTLNSRIMLGEEKVLHDYAILLRENPREILPSIVYILDAANQHNFNIDKFLEEFNLSLQQHVSFKENSYTLQISNHRYVLFLQKLSVYHYNQGRFEESLQAVLQSWELSNQTNNHSHLRMFASLAVMYNTPPEEKVDS